MINKYCYVCSFPIVFSKTRTKKYYCEKHNICATEKTKILKKRGRKKLDEIDRIEKEIERKKYKKILNRDYYNFVVREKRQIKKESR
nr:hypothetical protein GTC16762_33110 [Pigmentibacter ruber]